MAKLLSENAAAVLSYLQANQDVDLTAKALSEALSIKGTSMNGFLRGLQAKGFIVREEVEGQKDRVIRLTPEGAVQDPYAEKAE